MLSPEGNDGNLCIFVQYLFMFCCFCIINAWQHVARHHVIIQLYSYISGGQAVLELIFDTGHIANIVGATLGVW